MLQQGVSHRCASVKLSTKGVGIAPFWELLTSLNKYRPIWGIAAILSQYLAGATKLPGRPVSTFRESQNGISELKGSRDHGVLIWR